MSELSRVFDYFYSYDTDTFAVFSCQGVEPTEADVERFEASAGFRLPSEFREFTMSALGGLYMEVREHLWPRPEVLDVGPSYGLKVFGLSDEIPKWLSLEHELEELRLGGGRDDLVPFLSAVGDANRYCFDPQRQIRHWAHDDPDGPTLVESTFVDLLLDEIRELEARVARQLAER